MLPRLRRLAVQHQIGQQRPGTRQVQRRQWFTAEAQVKLVEKPDPQDRPHTPQCGGGIKRQHTTAGLGSALADTPGS
ncbi:MAG: hypothetical protein ACRDZO_12395 [Egibacteraceae bacterium]